MEDVYDTILHTYCKDIYFYVKYLNVKWKNSMAVKSCRSNELVLQLTIISFLWDHTQSIGRYRGYESPGDTDDDQKTLTTEDMIKTYSKKKVHHIFPVLCYMSCISLVH